MTYNPENKFIKGKLFNKTKGVPNDKNKQIRIGSLYAIGNVELRCW